MNANRDQVPDFRLDESGSERLGETPIEEAPERHPLSGGTSAQAAGVGAVIGAVAGGALAGTLTAGPAGTVLGAAIGAIAGGLGGKAVAEHTEA